MNISLEKINKIPVRTFNFLNVNDVSLENIEVSKSDFKNMKLCEINSKGVTLKENKSKIILNDNSYDGVDSTLLKENLNNFNSGFELCVDKQTNVNEDIFIKYIADKNNKILIDSNIIEVSENSSVNMYLDFSGDVNSYHQGFINISLKENSKANIVLIQNFDKSSTNIQSILGNIEKNAKLSLTLFDLGSLNSVVNTDINLNGINSNATLKSIYISDHVKKLDLNYKVTHLNKNTISNSYTKGVLLDESKKVFKGSLDFRKGSKNSSGNLEEDVLLFSKNTKNSSVPLLLCNEDDVRGSHSSRVTKIDEKLLFYLMTRGLDYENSKKILLEAHIFPIINSVKDEKYKSYILDTIFKKVNLDG